MYAQFHDVETDSATYPPKYSLVNQQTQTVRYECSRCDSLFTSRIYLHHHEATSHSLIFHCPFCSALFSNKPDFQTHVVAHSEKRYLPCAFCNKKFDEIDVYKAHVKEHREPFMYPCDKCPAQFLQYSSLRIHSAIHVQKKFVHVIPKVSEFIDYSRKKFPKKILKKLKSKKNEAVTKNQVISETRDSQTTDSSDAVISASTNFVPTISSAVTYANCSSPQEDNVVEEETYVSNLNRKKNSPKKCRSVKNKIGVKSTAKKNALLARSRSQKRRKVDDSAEIIPSSLKDDGMINEGSATTVNISKRNLRPRKTSNCLNRGNYNFRRRAKINNVYAELISGDEEENLCPRRKSGCSGFFMCLSCKRMFVTFHLLNQHKRLHIEKKGMFCNICGGLFGGAGNLVAHMKSCVSS